MVEFDLVKHLKRQYEWSKKTFGPPRTMYALGVIDHLRKEIEEMAAETYPDKRKIEWVDIIILAFDGYMREGGQPEWLCHDILYKQEVNEFRTWPDWRTADPDKAIEHVRDPVETAKPKVAEAPKPPLTIVEEGRLLYLDNALTHIRAAIGMLSQYNAIGKRAEGHQLREGE